MPVKRRNIRAIEILSGFFLILTVLSMLIAYLLKFDYSVPNATFEEDIDFILDNILRQRISAITWLIAGSIATVFIPLYLLMFQRFQKGMHILSSFFILAMAYAFFQMSLNEFYIARVTAEGLNSEINIGDATSTGILIAIRNILIWQKVGITAFGAFTTVFTISRFSEVKFPVLGSMMAFLAAPILITFTWLNPDHLLMTSSLAASWAGLLIIGTRLVNRGLKKKEMKL